MYHVFMVFLNFLPDAVKELLKHVPTLMLDLVDWKDLAREIPVITAKIVKREGFTDFFAKQNPFLNQAGVNTVISTSTGQIQAPAIKSTGEFILTTYFAQLYSPHGLFLDLRMSNIFQGPEGHALKPGPLWVTFNETFRTGLIRMYQGFYYQDDVRLEEGLIETGLLKPEWDQSKKDELKTILKKHFANSLDEDMRFEIQAFQNSFLKIAAFLAENKVKIPHDFMYLGIYLISMYLALQTIPDALPVSRIFRQVDSGLNPPRAS